MNLSESHFQIFGVPEEFEMDLVALEERYRELQSEVHPDRFAGASQAEQRVSMQLSTRVNEAYQTLKSPLERAGYILQLKGVDPEFETSIPRSRRRFRDRPIQSRTNPEIWPLTL